jgi:glyoxylase-like metal-dependent hydrolase (beta-lactamase superfamily II)
MPVELRAFTTGYLTIPLGFMLAGREGTIKVPVCCYLITHRRGQVVFDTGLHPATQHNPTGHVGELLASFHEFDFHPGEDLAARLQAVDVDPGSVTHVVNSHLHFDHCGGNEFFPRSTFLVQRRELEAARDPAILSQKRYAPSAPDFDHPLAYRPVDGEHDVFGDGTVVLIPTHGHTPGHQSLRVRAGKGADLVLAADACYTRENMDRDLLPGVLWDPGEMARSLAHLRALRDRQGATIIFGHDPAQWEELPRAPEPLAAG